MRYTTSVYFFNEKQELIRRVTERYLTQLVQEKEITDDKSELLLDILTVSTIFDKRIANAVYMAVKESDKSFSLYYINSIEDPDNRLIFTGVNFALKELDGYVVKDIRPVKRTVNYVATQILQVTDGEWRLGYVKPNLPMITDTFYYLSVKDCLKQLQTHGCEVLFKCKIQNRRITDKWIEIYDKIGTASNKRFVYGGSALSVVKEQDRSQIYTSLIGRGKGEEVGDGYGRRLEFTDLVWKTSAGKPANKPANQNWIELPEMTAKYGIPKKNGTMRKREGVVVFEDIEDTETLLLNTYNALVEMSRPLIQFKTQVFSGDAIGNTIPVIRYDRDYRYRARIFKVTIDRLMGKVTSDVGDNLGKKSTIKVTSGLRIDLDRVETTKPSFYTAEQIAQWQTDIIRGLKGGSFVILTEEDLGISDERIPFCSVWMNGKSLETSDHFLVANSEGIGFIDGDFNLDNFHTAWTIDGVFNARFIQVGRLGGEQVFMDLDTGEVFFGKGWIKSTNGNMQINITEGIIEGPIIRSYTNKGITAGIEIQAGEIRVLDSSKNMLGAIGTTGLTGGSMRISNRQGKSMVVGTESGGSIGTLLSIPSSSTVTNPELDYYGTHDMSGAKIGTGSSQYAKFMTTQIGSTKYPAIFDINGRSGVAFGGSELYLIKGNQYYTLSDILNITTKLKALGSVKIPSEIRGDGTVGTYYNVYF
nr:MAG TPA: tail protein [Caudoviricetes sp.]